MSAARKTLKILALIYFVLGIASLVIGIAGIATGKFESIYGSNAILAAVVVIIKGVVDLAAGVAGIKGANKPSQVDGAFKRCRGRYARPGCAYPSRARRQRRQYRRLCHRGLRPVLYSAGARREGRKQGPSVSARFS